MGRDYTATVVYGTVFKYSDVPDQFMNKIEEEYMMAKNNALGWLSVPDLGQILYLTESLVTIDRHDRTHTRQLNISSTTENQFGVEVNKYPPLLVRIQQLGVSPNWYLIYD